jgi:hypothetical protein
MFTFLATVYREFNKVALAWTCTKNRTQQKLIYCRSSGKPAKSRRQ